MLSPVWSLQFCKQFPWGKRMELSVWVSFFLSYRKHLHFSPAMWKVLQEFLMTHQCVAEMQGMYQLENNLMFFSCNA